MDKLVKHIAAAIITADQLSDIIPDGAMTREEVAFTVAEIAAKSYRDNINPSA